MKAAPFENAWRSLEMLVVRLTSTSTPFGTAWENVICGAVPPTHSHAVVNTESKYTAISERSM